MLGNNLFGQAVIGEEDKRIIEVNGQQVGEGDSSLSPLYFNRVKTEQDYQRLLQACFTTDILKSFDRNIGRLFATLFSTSPKKHSKFPEFVSDIRFNSRKKILSDWRLGLSLSLPKDILSLSRSLSVKNQSGFPFGIQLGLAHFFEKGRSEFIAEFGLESNLDAATFNYLNREIFAKNVLREKVAPKANVFEFDDLTSAKNTAKNVPSFGKKVVKNNTEKALALLNDDKVIKILWSNHQLIAKNPTHKYIFIENGSLPEIKQFFRKHLASFKSCQAWYIKNQNGTFEEETVATVWFVNWHKQNKSENVSLVDFSGAKARVGEKHFEIHAQKGRELYRAVSKSNEPTGMISNLISQEVFESISDLKKQHGNIDKWIAKLLKITESELFERLTAEQIDAVALGVNALQKQKGLIIADETGFGKGRILAAISMIGHNLGKNVIFFTENKQLFSDFYRDILAVNPKGLLPLLLNQDAKLYDPEGNLVLKSQTPKKFKEMLEKQGWDKGESRLLITNYAQINRAGLDQPKMQFLKNMMGNNTWVLLDESHNASGNSNVNENLKHLLEKAEGVVFSSATYAKTEEKLELYDKVLPLSDVAKRLISISLTGDNDELREVLTKEMAKQGNFIRREHPPIDLPEVQFIETPEMQENLVKFSAMWNKILTLVEYRERMLGYFNARAWLTIGSALSLSIREFNMFSKIPALTELVLKKLAEDKKVVIATEMTGEANLAQVLAGKFSFDDNETDDLEEATSFSEKVFDNKPLWNLKWKALLDSLEENEIKELEIQKKNPEFSIENYYAMKKDYPTLKAQVIEEIEKNDYFSISPFDELVERLTAKNIPIDELSGRKHRLWQREDGKWVVDNRLKKKERTELVFDFNNSTEQNVLLVTRAGATGISLHAGAKFKDQRQRHFVEWTISANSAIRLQFLGRVRRRDQVIEPEFSTLLLKTPSDIRKWEVEKRKQVVLSAHTGGRKENKVLDWMSKEGNMIVSEWAKENPELAKRIGVYSDPDISKALNRSIILSLEEQQLLFDFIEQGIACHTDYHFFCEKELPNSRVLWSEFLWGNPNTSYESEKDYSPMNYGALHKVCRQWLVKSCPEAKMKYKPANNDNFELINNWFENDITSERKQKIAKAVRAMELKAGKPFYWFNGLSRIKGVMLDMGYHKYLSLNTVYIKVLFEREKEPVNVPLIFFVSNRDFKVRCSSDNFSVNDYILTETIEGNPILLSAWNKKMQAGEIRTINDLNEGEITSLLIKQYDNTLIPFVENAQVKDVLSALYKEGRQGVFDRNNKVELKMIPTAKSVAYQLIYHNYGEYKAQSKGWVRKATKFIMKREFSNGKMYLTIPYKFFFHVLSLMQEDSIFFFLRDMSLFESSVAKYISDV